MRRLTRSLLNLSLFSNTASPPTSKTLKVGPEADDVENSMVVEAEPESSRWRRRRIDNFFRPRRFSAGSHGMRSRTYSFDDQPSYNNEVVAARDLSRSAVSGIKIRDSRQQNETILRNDDVMDVTGRDDSAVGHRSRRKRDQNDNTTGIRSIVKNEPHYSKITRTVHWLYL